MKHEFSSVAVYSQKTFSRFAAAIFRRRLVNEGSENVWKSVQSFAKLICERSDVQAHFAQIRTLVRKGKEKATYPFFLAISEIAAMHDIAIAADPPAPTPPDPFISQNASGSWVKTPEADDYTPLQRPEFTLIDTHGSLIAGLEIEERLVFEA